MMDCLLYRLGKDNETMYQQIHRTCRTKFYSLEDRIYRQIHTIEYEEYDRLLKEETVYKQLCKNPVREESKTKLLKLIQVKCLKERVNSVIGKKVFDYCWTTFYDSNTTVPTTESEWLSFACPLEHDAQLRAITGRIIADCFRKLVTPENSYDMDDDPLVTQETKISTSCLRDTVDLESKRK